MLRLESIQELQKEHTMLCWRRVYTEADCMEKHAYVFVIKVELF